jgi:2'-5' RNA ligase
MQSREHGRRQRVFFALLPGARERELLASVARLCAERSGGRGVQADNLHVTLAFIGEVGAPQVDALCGLANGIAFAPFTLCFDRVQFRRRQQMVWIGCRETPPALQQLVSALHLGLAGQGFRTESRPFVTHVTAVRRARRAPRVDIEPIEAALTGFCLMRSHVEDAGVRYERIGAWPPAVPAVDGQQVT